MKQVNKDNTQEILSHVEALKPLLAQKKPPLLSVYRHVLELSKLGLSGDKISRELDRSRSWVTFLLSASRGSGVAEMALEHGLIGNMNVLYKFSSLPEDTQVRLYDEAMKSGAKIDMSSLLVPPVGVGTGPSAENESIQNEVSTSLSCLQSTEEEDAEEIFRVPFSSGESICADAMNVLKTLPENSVPLVLTDIPYGVVNRSSAGIRVFDKNMADVMTIPLKDLVDALVRVCSGSLYVFCSTEQVSELRAGFAFAGMTTRLGIWEKTNPTPVNGQHLWLSGVETCIFARKKGAFFSEHCKNSVWRFPNGRSKRHPTEKPLKLIEYLMSVSSKPGDLVLDPFSGSGTTGEAAINLRRRFVCIEKNREYFDRAVERLRTAESRFHNNKIP